MTTRPLIIESERPAAAETRRLDGLLPAAACHELYAAGERDATAATGLGLGLAARCAGRRPVLLVRHALGNCEAGMFHPPGFSEFGLDPARFILVHARDPQAALQAGLEGVRCAGLGAVLVEIRGAAKAYDLTASRRLALAAKASGVMLLVLRSAAEPHPSAAETRWRVAAAPSKALAANAPGNPAFDLTLLRARGGQEGLRFHLEWDRDAGTLVICAFAAQSAGAEPAGGSRSPPLSGAVVPVSFDRSGEGPAPARRAV